MRQLALHRPSLRDHPPAAVAQREDPFGLKSGFVGLGNFRAVLSDETYLHSLQVTVIFSVATALLSMIVALALATAADKVMRGQTLYRRC